MGHLVGQHPILREAHHRVLSRDAEVAHRVEHVDGQTFESAVHATQAEDGIVGTSGLEEEGVLGELAQLDAHVVEQLHRDLAVAGLVPRLAGHVELELVRRVGIVLEVVGSAAGSFQSLDLAHEDAVHEAPRAVG